MAGGCKRCFETELHVFYYLEVGHKGFWLATPDACIREGGEILLD